MHKINLIEGYQRPYICPVHYAYREKVKIIIDDMIKNEILRASASQYTAPLLFVPKKDGKLRICVDYRAINAVTVADNYNLPRIGETKQLVRGKYFSSIDLRDGFWQVSVVVVIWSIPTYACNDLFV